MSTTIDGVTLKQVEDQLKKTAANIMRGYKYAIHRVDDEVSLDCDGCNLEFVVGDYINLCIDPYWWMQIIVDGKPIHFGKATMQSIYKLTIRDAVQLFK